MTGERHTESGRQRGPLLVGALFCALISCAAASGPTAPATNNNRTDVGGKLRIEGGWSEVKKGWPAEDADYFLATEKGHHFVESRNLPRGLKHDLKVTFKYYYSYARSRPVLQMTPCRKNIYLIDEDSPEQSNRWLEHTYRVDRNDCAKRNELAYNVLLHDAGDVFAWKEMKIESIAELPDGAASVDEATIAALIDAESQPTPTPTEEPAKGEEASSETSYFPPGYPKRPAAVEPTTEASGRIDATTRPSSQPETTTKAPATAEAPPATRTPTWLPDEKPTTVDPILNLITTARPSPSAVEKEAAKVEGTKTPARPEEATSETSYFPANYPRKDPPAESPPAPAAKNDDPADANLNLRRRRKRATLSELDEKNNSIESGGGGGVEFSSATCVPSSCNKNLFKMARFSALIKGLPRRPARAPEASKYLVNLKNAPLVMTVESSDEPLTEVDTCVSFLLYMEANTELELLLDRSSSSGGSSSGGTQSSSDPSASNSTTDSSKSHSAESGRRLELIRRKASDSTAGKWDQFSRCISDYMPQYKALEAGKSSKANAGGAANSDNSMHLILRPRGEQRPGQVALLIAEHEASYLANLYRKQSFLPDIKRLSDARDFGRLWLLDRDGLAKPEVTPKSPLVAEKKLLQINNIDATQETFDITSRWLQIKEAETLELPVLFVYKFERADWIDHVNFEYQRADDASDDWITQVAYKAAAAADSSKETAAPNATDADSQRAKQQGSEASSAASQVAQQVVDKVEAREVAAGSAEAKAPATGSGGADAQKSTSPDLVDLPIRLKGLDSGEFRLRLRHYLRVPAANTSHQLTPDERQRTLKIKSLAFADVCAYGRPYCQNNGECRPTGAAQAECLCAQGYSGRYCEHVRPCDVIYRSASGERLSGRAMCESLGARCVDQLPVMRCEWPNDKYYQCKTLYKLDAATSAYVPSSSGGGGGGGSGGAAGGGSQEGGAANVGEPQSLIDADDESLSLEERFGKLKSVVGQQAKLIIILAVFIVAILIFALVLVGSMVSRLRKSSRRLKRSQGEIHELSKRAIHPGGFGGAAVAAATRGAASGSAGPFNRAKSASPASALAYNNSAFDVES